MPKTGENIYKRKDGRWEGRYKKERINGKIHYGVVYARTYRDVKAKLDEAKRAMEIGKLPTGKAGKVQEIGSQWLSEVRLTLKESSQNKYEDLLRRYILPALGERELSEITNQHISIFINDLLTDGGEKGQGLSPATVAEILSVLNGIRVYALRRDCTVLFSTECVKLKRDPHEIRVFSLWEEELLIQYLLEHMDFSSLGILFCLYLLQYYLKKIEVVIGKRIVIFGAGKVGQDYYTQLSKYRECYIVAWVDSNWDKYKFDYADVIKAESINTLLFDLIIIAVIDEKIGKEIKDYLINSGVEERYYGKSQESIFRIGNNHMRLIHWLTKARYKIMIQAKLQVSDIMFEHIIEFYYKIPCFRTGIISSREQRPVVISLTTIPSRLDKAWLTIESLLRQSKKPNKIILWLAEDEF